MDTIKEKEVELIEKEREIKKEEELKTKRQQLEKSVSKDKALHDQLVWEVNKLKKRLNQEYLPIFTTTYIRAFLICVAALFRLLFSHGVWKFKQQITNNFH